MKNKQNLLKILLVLLALLLSLLGVDLYQHPSPPLQVQEGVKEVKAEEVIDGDTIRVRDLQSDEIFRVRYLGIDTPELEGPDYESCFGSQAQEKNEDLLKEDQWLCTIEEAEAKNFQRALQ